MNGTANWQITAPGLAVFEEMAAAAYAALPATFRTHAGNLVIRVADFPPDDVLAEMGAEDPYQLTGLYDGVALTQQSVLDAPSLPPAVWLFRRPILDEWAERGDVALDRLVAHVLVHEVAHHYGFSDEDIAAIDAWWL